MSAEASCEPARHVSSAKREPVTRARSVPHRQGYVRAVILSSIHYLAVLATVTSLVLFFIHPTLLATKVFILCLGLSIVTWVFAFFKRRHTHCPLCKGTPLVNTGALAHKKARRIYPLNHGVTAILSIIATQKFRCMYCGTEFDLLKTPSHLLTSEDGKYYGDYSTYTADEKKS